MAPVAPQPEYVYYQRANYNLAAAIALPILCITAVALRLFARRKQKLALKIDDWLTIPALIFTLGANAAMIAGIALHGEGYAVPRPTVLASRATAKTPQEAVIITSKVEFVILLLVTLGLYCVKMSLLSFYHRIFCVHKIGVAQYAIFGTMILVTGWGLAFLFAHIFACRTDFQAFWGTPNDLATKCFHTLDFELAFSASDFALDAIIFITPIPLLWGLQLRTARKVAVIAIFMIGAGAITASAVRLALVAKVVNNGFSPNEDEDLTITGMMYWLLVELSLGLLAACLPTIRILFAGFSVESVINSIRSAISLSSLRSQRSRTDHEQLHDDGSLRDLRAPSTSSK